MKRIDKDGKINKVKVNTSAKGGKTYWTNDSVKMIDEIECHIPKSIANVMNALNIKFPSSEFSIFCKSDYNATHKSLEIGEEYFIPNQEVSGAGVDYKEDAPEGYNVVIHKHPRGCRNFSGTDNTYINQNFDISLLWETDFVKGQIRIKTEYGFIKLNLKIYVEHDNLPIIPDDSLKKIREQVATYYGGNGKGWGYYNEYMNPYSGKNPMFGGNNSNKSLPVWGANNSDPVWKNKPPCQADLIERKGAFLTTEQEEVQNFLDQQEEELIEYLEELNELMSDNPGMSWNEAEEVYKTLNANNLANSTLDFSKQNLGIISPGSSETDGCKGPCDCGSHVKKFVDMTKTIPKDAKKIELINLMKEKGCGLEVAKTIYAVRHPEK